MINDNVYGVVEVIQMCEIEYTQFLVHKLRDPSGSGIVLATVKAYNMCLYVVLTQEHRPV